MEEQSRNIEIRLQDQDNQLEEEEIKENAIPQNQQYPQLQEVTTYYFDTEIQLGIFNSIFLLEDTIKQNINRLDSSGYSILHHAITYKRFDIVKYLIENGADIHQKSTLGQSPLMIASNFAILDIFKLLLDMGASINDYDNNNFSPLLYASKSKRYAIVLYLLIKEAKYDNMEDSNGCSMVHWAAYNNDTWLLRFYDKLKPQYQGLDKQNTTPLDRALQNYSYDAIEYIVDRNPLNISQNINKLSPSIQRRIKNSLRMNRIKRQRIYAILQYYHKQTLSALYILFYVLFGYSYSLSFSCQVLSILLLTYSQQLSQGLLGYSMNLIYLIVLIYSIVYSSWFILGTTSKQNEGLCYLKDRMGNPNQPQQKIHSGEDEESHINKEGSKQIIDNDSNANLYGEDLIPKHLQGIDSNKFKQFYFIEVDSFVQRLGFVKDSDRFGDEYNPFDCHDQVISSSNYWYRDYSILHQVYYLVENHQFRLIEQIDWMRICGQCLQYQIPRQEHCKECNQCVLDYSHHSMYFQKCINSSNHLFYVLLLIQQEVMFLITVQYSYFNYFYLRNTNLLLYPLEIVYLQYHKESSCLPILIYVISTIILIYNSLLLIFEIICIFLNLTRFQIFSEYPNKTLYEIFKAQNDFVYNYPKARIMRTTNLLMPNLQNYFSHSFNYLKLL